MAKQMALSLELCIGDYGSDVENRREQPSDLTYIFVCVHELSHPYILPLMQSLLETVFPLFLQR